MKQLKDKVAAVTGAGSGIGRGLALGLAAEGCHLALADINAGGLEETVKLLAGRPVKITTRRLDVAEREEVSRWAEETVRDHGGVDVIINNAGVVVYDTLENVSYEDFEWLFNVDFWGVVYGTKAFLPHLRRRPEGHIVNISSINGMVPFPYNGPYNAAKFALRGLNKTLIQELRGSTIHLTSVHPGGIQTNIARNARVRRQPDQALEGETLAEMFDQVAKTTPDRAAQKIVRAIRKNRERLLIGPDAIFMDLMSRLAPLTTTKVTGMIYAFIQARKAKGRTK